MARGLRATIDPDTAPLVLDSPDGDGAIRVIGLGMPGADDDIQWVPAAEGELVAGTRASNQPIPLRLRISGSGATDEDMLASFVGAQRALDQKVIKLRREGGVLRLEFPGLDTIDWVVVAVTGGERLIDNRFMRRYRTEDDLTFICLPGGRGQEYEVPLPLERDTPCLITEPFEVRGDMEAFGRLVLRNETDRDVTWLRWGRESRHLSTAATAALHYDAVDLTPLGAASVVGSVVRQGTLAPGWLAMLSTEIAGVGQMTHAGVFEVRARLTMPTTNVGEVQIAFEWWRGDGTSRTVNAPLIFAPDHSREGQKIQVALGEVRIDSASPSWQGRLLARSTTVGDDLDAHDIELVPLIEGNGTLAAITQVTAATTPAAVDGFEHPAGVLAGNTAPIGGSWVESGAAGSFQVGSRTVTRTTVGAGYRIATLGGVDAADIEVSWTLGLSFPPATEGVTQSACVLRHVDDANFACAGVSSFRDVGGEWHTFFVYQVIGGAVLPLSIGGQMAGAFYGTRQFRVACGTNGRLAMYVDETLVLTAVSRVHLVAGGILESGSVGFWDYSTRARTRTYSALFAGSGGQSLDAVAFAGQDLELRHDGVDRRASDGLSWGRVADPAGDYLRLAPGSDGRGNRIIAIPCDGFPDEMPDSGTGRLSARLFATPRYRTVPDIS